MLGQQWSPLRTQFVKRITISPPPLCFSRHVFSFTLQNQDPERHCAVPPAEGPTNNTLGVANASPATPIFFPYGQQNFAEIRKAKQWYSDKTHVIPVFEKAGKHSMFLRPPRFGKSLLNSTLHSYYDLRQKNEFNNLFGDLYIGKNPIPLKNCFYVLPLDFSIDTTSATPTGISAALRDKINYSIMNFSQDYVSRSTNPRLLVLIDEYDRFANKLMLEDIRAYNKVVTGTSGVPLSSPIRAFYEAIKTGNSRLMDYRSITFGIAPLALADASGANNIEQITLVDSLADACGLTKRDLSEALAAIGVSGNEQAVVLEVMQRYYNGYRFHENVPDEKLMYNTTLCLSFFRKYLANSQFRDVVQSWKQVDPQVLVDALKDPNTQPSDNIISLFCKPPVNSKTQAIIEELLNPMVPVNISSVDQTFKLPDLLRGSQASRQNMLSLMWYHGWVTFIPPPTTDPSARGKRFLRPPNTLVTGPLFNHLREKLQLNMDQIVHTICHPNEETVKNLLWGVICKLGVRMDNAFPEAGLHAALESAFRATVGLKGVYTVSSEFPLLDVVGGKTKWNEARVHKLDYAKRHDLILRYENQVLMLELKRLRPNGIIIPGKDKSFQCVSLHGILQQFQKFTEQATPETLRSYKLSELLLNILKERPGTTVADLERKAQEQARKYKQLLLANDPTIESIEAFTVVQVGWPLLVKRVQDVKQTSSSN
ncbi:AAA family ATPase [Balamuthia mandrillaris]